MTRTPLPPFIFGNSFSRSSPLSTELRPKRLESLTTNPSMTPDSRSDMRAFQPSRSYVVPETPSSAYSRTILRSSGLRSQYWRMICCWLTMLPDTPSESSPRDRRA